MKNILSVFTQYKGLSKSAYVIFVARLVTSMGAFIWPLLTLILSRKVGYSASTIAIVSLGVGFLYIPASIVGGKLADKYNKKKLIIILDSLSIIFFISCAFVEPGNLMVGLFILAGMFANMEGPAFSALVAEASKPNEREKVYSLMYLGMNLGLIFGAAVGGLMFENHLQLMFLLDGLTTMISTLLIIVFVKTLDVSTFSEEDKNEYEDHEEEDKKVSTVLKERRPVLIQIMMFILVAMIYDQWSFVIPLYLEEIFASEGAKYFGLLASFNGFVVILFTPIITRVLQKVNEMPKMIIGVTLYSLSYLLIRDTAVYFVFFVMMTAFTIGEIVNLLGSSTYVSKRVPASHRGRISSLRGIGGFLGAVTGRIIVGVLIDNYSYSAAFTFLCVLGIVSAIIIAFNYKLDKKTFPKLYDQESVDKAA